MLMLIERGSRELVVQGKLLLGRRRWLVSFVLVLGKAFLFGHFLGTNW